MSGWARGAAAVAALLALGSLWLPWYQPDGDFLILFGALDRYSDLQRTAWRAFAWEDVAMAGLAVATVALALVNRPWFVVPIAGALVAAATVVGRRSIDLLADVEPAAVSKQPMPMTEWGFIPLVAFAVAAVAVASGRYRLARRG